MNTVDVRQTLPVMPGATDAYRASREQLRAAELAMRDRIEAVAELRRALPAGPEVRNYEFLEGDKHVTLGDLFTGGESELIIYHLMYWAVDDEFCPMCSMWIDGLDAVAKHIEQRASFAVATRASAERLRDWARRRGWRHARLLSDADAEFARDIGAEDSNGDPVETIAVFTKDGDTIRNSYLAHAYTFGEARGIDLLSPVWHALDLTPSGRGDWLASNDYITREPA